MPSAEAPQSVSIVVGPWSFVVGKNERSKGASLLMVVLPATNDE
jgi:hypothetical protein